MPNVGTVSAFAVAGNGTLIVDRRPRPSPTSRRLPAGSRSATTASTCSPSTPPCRSISRYPIAASGSLTLLGSTAFNLPSGLGPLDARLAPDGKTLWVVDSGAAKVSGFRVNGGNLTELGSSPTALPAGATAFGIVVT